MATKSHEGTQRHALRDCHRLRKHTTQRTMLLALTLNIESDPPPMSILKTVV